ncbi:MAG: TlpA family protein disulfide reductase [Deltaproteobacteria bacterium]|nr:TlpA family protein disulfide reductase [Deltaproteobacteria bacterium]
MKKELIFVTALWIFLGLFPVSVLAGGHPEKGGTLPTIVLPVPENDAHKAYLGLSEGKTFVLSDIKAKVLMVEIFSMYCPHCQVEAPAVNRLYREIAANPLLKQNIRMIGIGVGNSAFEVNTFREKFAIPFPLFPDPDFKIHNALGKVRTPFFIGIKRENKGVERIFLVQLGGFGSVGEFLQRIVQESGLDESMKKGESR